jgi:hypothetical protein
MNIKTIIEFSSKDDIHKIIFDWAKKTSFYEYSSANTEGLVDINNVTYCYCLDQGDAKTFITIHQLDQIIHIEAWVAEEIKHDKESMQSINELLIMLGQRPCIK